MKAFIIAILFMLTGTAILDAAEPVVEVPPLPPQNQLELYEDSEGLFAIMIMDYYQRAVALETQLLMMGVKPSQKIFPPTFEELEDLDARVIKKYHFLARTLEVQVIQSQETQVKIMENKMQDTINFWVDKYWETKNECFEKIIKEINKHDSICNDRLQKLEDQYYLSYKNSVTVLSCAVSENLFISYGNSKVDNDPSLAVRLNLNAYKLLGFWRGLDFWYEYMAPRITTTVKFEEEEREITLNDRWDTDVSSLGISSTIQPIFDRVHYADGLRIGLGYFWAEGDVFNRDEGYMSWSGARLDLSYYAGPFDQKIPLEIFFGLSLYHSFNDDLVFHPGIPFVNPVNVNRTHISLSLGLRLNFWRSPI